MKKSFNTQRFLAALFCTVCYLFLPMFMHWVVLADHLHEPSAYVVDAMMVLLAMAGLGYSLWSIYESPRAQMQAMLADMLAEEEKP